MNKNRLALLLLIVGTTALISFFIARAFFEKNSLKPVEVYTTQPIATDISEPSAKIFNGNAINPTNQITISDNNQSPIGN